MLYIVFKFKINCDSKSDCRILFLIYEKHQKLFYCLTHYFLLPFILQLLDYVLGIQQ